jgi:hypothetical protein
VKFERGEEANGQGVAPKVAFVSRLELVVAACGDDDGSSLASAAQGLCSSLQSLDSTVDQITSADAGSTVQMDLQQLGTAWTNTLDALNCSSS